MIQVCKKKPEKIQMIKGKHKRKILAGLKRDRLSGAFDRLSCSKKGKRRMEKLIYKSKYENQFIN